MEQASARCFSDFRPAAAGEELNLPRQSCLHGLMDEGETWVSRVHILERALGIFGELVAP